MSMNTEDIEIVEVEDQSGRMRMLVMDGGMQSATYIDKDRRNELIFKYMIRFAELSALNKEAEKVLLIGAGTFSYPKYLISENSRIRIDALDPDEELFEYACDWFYLDELIEEYNLNETERLQFIVDYGRDYLENNDKKYDIIINDAFNGLEPVPDLCTLEAMELIHSRLNENGMFLVNIPGWKDPDDSDFLKSSIETMKQVFTHVVTVLAKGAFSGDDSMNYVIMASDTYDHFDEEIVVHSDGAPLFRDEDPESIYECFDWV